MKSYDREVGRVLTIRDMLIETNESIMKKWDNYFYPSPLFKISFMLLNIYGKQLMHFIPRKRMLKKEKSGCGVAHLRF